MKTHTRINLCPACVAQKNGVRTRIALEHTCNQEPSPNTTIEFEDCGQDFLTWEISPRGLVVGCYPFQSSIWCGHLVVDPIEIRKGDYVTVQKGTSKPITIKYKVIKVTKPCQNENH